MFHRVLWKSLSASNNGLVNRVIRSDLNFNCIVLFFALVGVVIVSLLLILFLFFLSLLSGPSNFYFAMQNAFILFIEFTFERTKTNRYGELR